MTGVVMLVNKFPPLPAGGAEKQAERLAEYLGAQGLQVGVLTRGAAGLPGQEQRDGYWVRRIPQWGPGKLKMVTFTIGAMVSLFRRRREFAILHAHLAFAPAVAAAIIGRLLGKRVIVKFGNSGPFGDVQVSQGTLRGRLKLAMLRRWVDVDIALDSEMEAELLGANFPRDRVKRMVNGIDIDAFPVQADTVAAKAALGLAGKKVLLFTGRLAPQKALPDMLTALHRALVECPELHLLLIGEGSERAMLEQRVSELSLGQHVTFVGNVADVRKYLDGADIFVLSSVSEGISNALLEAMASGLACIATAVGGTPEVLEQGKCGVLLPPERPELLAAAIVDLCRRPAEVARLGAVARERILSHFAFSVVGNQYIALYERLLQGETRVSTVSKQITK